ncbi:hypothetical protein UlMin_010211 [Ulmus minor]
MVSPFSNLIILLFVIHIVITCDANIFQAKRTYIKIVNGNNTPLTVHCKSKNEDLGFHYLGQLEDYRFNFRTNLLGMTNALYFCRMMWNNNCHYFVIYDQIRDEKQGNNFCYVITPKGPCKCNCPILETCQTYDRNICFDWNKDACK